MTEKELAQQTAHSIIRALPFKADFLEWMRVENIITDAILHAFKRHDREVVTET